MGVYLGSNAVNVLGGQPSGGSSPTLQTKSKTYTPSASQQTESVTADSGYDGLGAVNITVNAMPSGTAGTPTATKGNVSNHQVSVTPSVTNTTGYITGSTKTGTAVTVTASELASGNKPITQNGTGIDVVGYSTVSVDVPSSGVDLPIFRSDADYQNPSCSKTWAECYNLIDSGHTGGIYNRNGTNFEQGLAATAIESTQVCYTMFSESSGEPLWDIYYYSNGTIDFVTPSHTAPILIEKSITANGTYSAWDDNAWGYYSVAVNVPSSSSKNVQVVQGTTRTTSSTLTAIGAEMTVSKTGTYDVYWSAFRSSTSSSYTYGTQLYVGGTAYGTQNTTWLNHVQNNHLSNVSLTANQKLRVYGRNSRGSSYYIYAPTLVIIEA